MIYGLTDKKKQELWQKWLKENYKREDKKFCFIPHEMENEQKVWLQFAYRRLNRIKKNTGKPNNWVGNFTYYWNGFDTKYGDCYIK